jgi:hypothetical protein
MKINTSYPYPVLYMNNDDYVKSSFSTSIVVHESFGEVKIMADFQLENAKIKSLIEEQVCVYLIHIECGQTSFRNVYKTNKDSFEIAIPTDILRGKVNIHSFIIAKEKIENYQNEDLNEWYQDTPVTFEKGNILAIGEAIEITLFEDHLELLNVPSIAKVIKSHKNEYMEVDLHANIITISLPEYEYNQYATNANSMLKNTILSTVIVPSLVYVFSKMKENRDDVEDYTWYQVLERIFEENSYRIEDVGTDTLSALKAAQMVLRKPLRTSFEEIEKFNKLEE